MTKLVTIIGGSGFVGRYVAQRMAQAGWRVRVACRHPNDAHFVRPYGAPGQVSPVFANIRDDDSVRAVVEAADAVVNCVGTFDAKGKNSFQAIQVEGAERVARIAAECGVSKLVQISAIGADVEAESGYARSKGEGERAVLEHVPGAYIIRPSVIFGTEDDFFNRFGAMARSFPIVPLFGAETKFQPVWVEDVAAAIEVCLTTDAAPGVYELGGPDVDTFRELMEQMTGVIRRDRPVLGFPFFMGDIIARLGGIAQVLSLGLIKAPVTSDQMIELRRDNVVSDGARGFAALGLQPTSMEVVLPTYLWRFRPDGQYNDLTRRGRQA